MAFKVHEIKKYNYSFEAGSGGASGLQLWSATGCIATIRFVDDDAIVPRPSLRSDLSGAKACLKRGSLPHIIDMLRNEDPVKMTVNNQPPGFVFIHTGLEPVGEGESLENE